MTVPTPGQPRPPQGSLSPEQGPLSPADPHGPDPRAAVAAAMTGLDGLAERPLAEHVEAYERVHAALGDALATGSA